MDKRPISIPDINRSINRLFNWVPISAYQGYRSFTACLNKGAKCYDFARHKARWILDKDLAREADLEYLFCRYAFSGEGVEPHAVLAIYVGGVDDDPLILDNIVDRLLPLSERDDLTEDAHIPYWDISPEEHD